MPSHARRAAPDVLQLHVHAPTRNVLEQIKRDCGLASDAQVIRQALSLQSWMAKRAAAGERFFVGPNADAISGEILLPALSAEPA